MSDPPQALTRDELFARLASGHAGRVTVITPNRRLAQAVAAEFDQSQLAARRAVWDTGDILPYTAFVERLYDDALYSERAAGLPLLLTPDQEQSLWEEVVRRSDAGGALLVVAETAALAAEAWQLGHAWRLLERLEAAPLHDDARAFADWARSYRQRTERARLTDRARLPDTAIGVLDHDRVNKPALLVAYGFDIVTPQQRALLDALAARGVTLATCGAVRRTATALRVAAADAHDEIRQAARWARARLEANGTARIAIVVPDLAARKKALRRVLAETMDPGRAASVLPVNVSLGDPLTGYPIVADALAALQLGGREIEFGQASRLIRSPFIAGAESELQRRARLDARLRKRAEPIVTLERLVRMVDDAPVLVQHLGVYAQFRKTHLFGARSPGDWARAFGDALSLLGFPGERGLDSAEYQALKKWHEVVARLAGLDRVAGRMGFEEALARLRRMAGATLFQPETPAVPIQVLGVLEAAGLAFDHLWVMGLSDESWPMHSRPNPFIPLRLQRTARIPNASPSATLELARRLTAEWLGCAGEVVLSHPRREQDRDLAASPLVAHVPDIDLQLPAYETWREAIHRGATEERLPDARAPALAPTDAVHGGALLLKDQAACPFRAFAVHRLAADAIEAPHTGLDARERGTLVHRVLASIWGELKRKQALDAIGAADLEALLTAAAEDSIARKRRDRPTTLGGRFAAIERARLVGLARAWLEQERGRSGFTVIAAEDKRAAALGAVNLSLRLDRVDETDAGDRIVIDYKTGKATVPSMLGARPDEPQLPLYATVAEPDAAAVAFGQVRSGEMKFVGLARDAGVLAGAKPPAPGWDEQRAFWRVELERLAGEFAAGNADVDPKRPPHTCRNCGLPPLCRIAERTARIPEDRE
ncbi:MAG TPA: PD-(D/E)XK nuclease family protein [Burkholderiales bacterium]|nr:PD-(D/E)XK nuclease family protein [Burkholderiales bacterium]